MSKSETNTTSTNPDQAAFIKDNNSCSHENRVLPEQFQSSASTNCSKNDKTSVLSAVLTSLTPKTNNGVNLLNNSTINSFASQQTVMSNHHHQPPPQASMMANQQQEQRRVSLDTHSIESSSVYTNNARTNIKSPNANHTEKPQLRCYLCDTPKHEYSLIHTFTEIVCRGCVNYEGPDRVEQLIGGARKIKSTSSNSSCERLNCSVPVSSPYGFNRGPSLRAQPIPIAREHQELSSNSSLVKGKTHQQQQQQQQQHTRLKQHLEMRTNSNNPHYAASSFLQPQIHFHPEVWNETSRRENGLDYAQPPTSANIAHRSSSPPPKRSASDHPKLTPPHLTTPPMYKPQTSDESNATENYFTKQKYQDPVSSQPTISSPVKITQNLVEGNSTNSNNHATASSPSATTGPSGAQKTPTGNPVSSSIFSPRVLPSAQPASAPKFSGGFLEQQLASYPTSMNPMRQRYPSLDAGYNQRSPNSALSADPSLNMKLASDYQQWLNHQAKALSNSTHNHHRNSHNSNSVKVLQRPPSPSSTSVSHQTVRPSQIEGGRTGPTDIGLEHSLLKEVAIRNSPNVYTHPDASYPLLNPYLPLIGQHDPLPYHYPSLNTTSSHDHHRHSLHQQQPTAAFYQQPSPHHFQNSHNLSALLAANAQGLLALANPDSQNRLLQQFYTDQIRQQQQLADDKNARRLIQGDSLSNDKQLPHRSMSSSSAISAQPLRPHLSPITPPISSEHQQNASTTTNGSNYTSGLPVATEHQQKTTCTQRINDNYLDPDSIAMSYIKRNNQEQSQYQQFAASQLVGGTKACCNLFPQKVTDKNIQLAGSMTPEEVVLLDEIEPPSTPTPIPVAQQQQQPSTPKQRQLASSEERGEHRDHPHHHCTNVTNKQASSFPYMSPDELDKSNSTNWNKSSSSSNTSQQLASKKREQRKTATNPEYQTPNSGHDSNQPLISTQLRSQSQNNKLNPSSRGASKTPNVPDEIESLSPSGTSTSEGSNSTASNNQHDLVENTILKCMLCGDRLEDKHFVQCPTVREHKFCFACSKRSIEKQRAEIITVNGNEKDKIFCPSGKKCLLANERSSWTFMNQEIETIFRESSRSTGTDTAQNSAPPVSGNAAQTRPKYPPHSSSGAHNGKTNSSLHKKNYKNNNNSSNGSAMPTRCYKSVGYKSHQDVSQKYHNNGTNNSGSEKIASGLLKGSQLSSTSSCANNPKERESHNSKSKS